MLCTVGNESLLRSTAEEQAAADAETEYPLTHMMSTPIEPNTAPRMIDLEHDPDALLYGH
jgi:hypothetical protein